MTRNASQEAREELADALAGAPIIHAIALVSRLAIPDLLASGPRTATDLAQETGSHEDALYRVLRALASAGVLAERTRGRFALTPISQLLRTGVPGSMRSVAILAGEPWRQAWYELPHAVRTGRPAFDRVHGASFYDWLSTDRDASRRFDEVQRYKWEALLEEVLGAYDFSQASRIVDVGGGSGTLIEAILAANPDQSGVLVEAPHIATEARRRLQTAGLRARCQVIAGDFVRSVPSGGDLYILAFVLHNWGDRAAVRILRNCRRAMTDGGRVVLIESILPEDLRPSPQKVRDLEMLVFMEGGRERARREYRALLEAADLRLRRVIATPTSASLLVAVRA